MLTHYFFIKCRRKSYKLSFLFIYLFYLLYPASEADSPNSPCFIEIISNFTRLLINYSTLYMKFI